MLSKLHGIACIISAFFLCAFLSSCSTCGDRAHLPSELHREGFISENIFQMIITGNPDSGALSLLDRRESSYIKAKLRIPSTVRNRLKDYIIRKNLSPANAGEVSENRESPDFAVINAEYPTEKIEKLFKCAYIQDEYYLEDASVVLIYRINKKGLKKELDSINTGTFTNKEKNQTSEAATDEK